MLQHDPQAGQSHPEKKTDLAEDRTVLANERTYTAWMRTGFAALVAGLGVLKFLEKVLPDWGLRCVASALVTYSVFCFLAGGWRHWHVGRHFPAAEVPHLNSSAVLAASLLLAACSVFAGVLVWLH